MTIVIIHPNIEEISNRGVILCLSTAAEIKTDSKREQIAA